MAAVEIFSDLSTPSSAPELCRALKLGRCLAEGPLEGGAEMTVAGKAEIEAERGQIVILAKEIERAGKAQPQLVAVERRRFHLLEDLGEIDRRDADLPGDLGECPAPCEIGGEHQLCPVDQFL